MSQMSRFVNCSAVSTSVTPRFVSYAYFPSSLLDNLNSAQLQQMQRRLVRTPRSARGAPPSVFAAESDEHRLLAVVAASHRKASAQISTSEVTPNLFVHALGQSPTPLGGR